MIRAGLAILLVVAAVVAGLALAGDVGRASLTWLGWRLDMTAATAVLGVLLGSLGVTLGWRTLMWVIDAPRRTEQARTDARRRQAGEVLTQGFLAAAAGDGAEARRLARKAADLAAETPGLVRVLAAQAAEAAGDTADAQAAYAAMLSFPEMRLAGHRGLMSLALARGDRPGALRHAQEAYALARPTRWAWRVLLEARLDAADWAGGLDLVREALARKIVPPAVAERARAALLAASAAQLEPSPAPKLRAQALDQAVEAARLQPGFAPGVVMAARLLAADGKIARAATALEQAWKVAPHPALWLAYRDLRTSETPRERATRLADLAAVNPAHRESRILQVERLLIAGDVAQARDAARALEGEPVTARIAGLMARAAFAAGDADQARLWMARGVAAPHEPDWSDLDPEGRAFTYRPSDWARLAITFAETGELIHPRFERRERGMGEAPDLPLAYQDAAPFITEDGGAPQFYATGPDDYGDEDLHPPPLPPPPVRRSSPTRRRPSSGPRAAK